MGVQLLKVTHQVYIMCQNQWDRSMFKIGHITWPYILKLENTAVLMLFSARIVIKIWTNERKAAWETWRHLYLSLRQAHKLHFWSTYRTRLSSSRGQTFKMVLRQCLACNSMVSLKRYLLILYCNISEILPIYCFSSRIDQI